MDVSFKPCKRTDSWPYRSQVIRDCCPPEVGRRVASRLFGGPVWWPNPRCVLFGRRTFPTPAAVVLRDDSFHWGLRLRSEASVGDCEPPSYRLTWVCLSLGTPPQNGWFLLVSL